MHLEACADIPLRTGGEESLIQALVQVRKALAVRAPVTLGIPTTASIVTTVEPLIVSPRRAWLAVQFELQQQLPYDVRQALWDYALIQPASDRAVVLAMKRALEASYVTACRRAGLSVAAISVGALAAANAWWRVQAPGAEGGAAPAILLHREDTVVEWIVLGPQLVQAVPMVLPDGAAPIGEALVSWLRGSWEGVRQLLGQTPTPAQVWLLGESATQSEWAGALAQVCGCSVEVIDPTRLVELSARTASPERLWSACGLALQGLGHATLAVNVLAQTRRQAHSRRVRRAAAVVSAVSLAIVIGCAAGTMLTILRARQQALHALITRAQTYTQLRPEAQALLKQQRDVEARLQQLVQLRQTHAVTLSAMREIVEALPEEMWLTKLELSQRGGVAASLEGSAKSFQAMNRLIEQLKVSGTWTSVKPMATTVTTDAATNQQAIVFSVQAQSLSAAAPPEAVVAAPVRSRSTPARAR
jgi:Tfp pilus assembly protein PilN